MRARVPISGARSREPAPEIESQRRSLDEARSERARSDLASTLLEALSTAQRRLKEKTMAKVMKSTDSSSLAEVVDRILDKGIVIDAWAKVSLVGIELLSIEARVVIASVETYLKYAEAIGLTSTAAAPAA
jgi:hypothetical protein